MEPTKPSDDGKVMAFLSYLSLFVGFPLWILPMIQKTDAYALHHAKQAGGVWIAAMVLWFVSIFGTTCLGVVTMGIGSLAWFCCLPFLFLPWVTMIHGFIVVANEKWDAPLLSLGIGDKLFGSVQVTGPS